MNWLERLAAIVTVIIGIPSILWTVYSFLGGADENSFLLNMTISLQIIFLTSWIFYREYKSKRKYKYHLIFDKIHDIVHSLRDVQSMLRERIDYNEIDHRSYYDISSAAQSEISSCLDKVVEAFSVVGTGRYRAAVKLIQYPEAGSNFFVFAYARDGKSQKECRADDEKRSLDLLDRLNVNEDFNVIFGNNERPGERSFVSNNLPKRRKQGYHNSSIDYMQQKARHGNGESVGFWQSVLHGKWPLPYKSTYVWPIRQSGSSLPIEEQTVLGFLAVDSTRTNAFDRNNDFAMGAAVADALYHPLLLLAELSVLLQVCEEQQSFEGRDDEQN